MADARGQGIAPDNKELKEEGRGVNGRARLDVKAGGNSGGGSGGVDRGRGRGLWL